MTTYPILTPVLALLRSRKFILFASALLVAVVVAYIPALEPVQDSLFAIIGTGMLAGITGITVEDAASKSGEWLQSGQKISLDKDALRENLLEILEGLMLPSTASPEQTVNVTVNEGETTVTNDAEESQI